MPRTTPPPRRGPHPKRAFAALVGIVVAFGWIAATATSASADPTGYTVLEAADTTCTLAHIDLATGATTPIGTPGQVPCASQLTFTPDGTLLGVDVGGSALVRYDVADGSATSIGPLPVTSILGDGGLAVDREGTLWLYLEGQSPPPCGGVSCLYRVDPATADGTFVGSTQSLVSGLAGQCDGRVLTFSGTPPQQLNAVDTTSGALSALGPIDGQFFVFTLGTEADGSLWALATPNNPAALTQNPATQILHIDPTGPAVVPGPVVSSGDTPLGLAIAPLACPTPPPAPPAPAPVVIMPSFTG